MCTVSFALTSEEAGLWDSLGIDVFPSSEAPLSDA